MGDPMLSMLVGVVASIASIVLIATVLRVRPNWTPVSVFVGGVALSEVAAVVIGVVWLDHFHFWPASAAVGAVGIANFFVFSAVYKSVSLQMLGVLTTQVECRTDKNLLVEAVARPAVEERMELLVEMGLVAKTPDQTYVPTAAGRQMIGRLQKLQRLFGISRSGLYRKT